MASVTYATSTLGSTSGMKAAVFTQYGKPLEIATVIAPISVATEYEAIVAIKSASVNPGDWKLRNGMLKLMTGSKFPKTLGHDFSGIVTHVGSKVTHIKVGDEVFGMTGLLGGSFAEHYCYSGSAMAKKATNQNWNEAASIPVVGFTAYHGIFNLAKVLPGQKVLIIGAGSGVGMFGVQFAKLAGATVWATCSAEKADLVRSLGADFVIDYKTQDLLEAMKQEKVDAVFDAVGNKTDRDKSFYIVKKNGVVVSANPGSISFSGSFQDISNGVGLLTDVIWKKISNYWTNGVSYMIVKLDETQFAPTLTKIAQWIEEGKLKTVIDSIFPLEEVEQAMKKSESGKVSGKIIVEVSK